MCHFWCVIFGDPFFEGPILGCTLEPDPWGYGPPAEPVFHGGYISDESNWTCFSGPLKNRYPDFDHFWGGPPTPGFLDPPFFGGPKMVDQF